MLVGWQVVRVVFSTQKLSIGLLTSVELIVQNLNCTGFIYCYAQILVVYGIA